MQRIYSIESSNRITTPLTSQRAHCRHLVSPYPSGLYRIHAPLSLLPQRPVIQGLVLGLSMHYSSWRPLLTSCLLEVFLSRGFACLGGGHMLEIFRSGDVSLGDPLVTL